MSDMRRIAHAAGFPLSRAPVVRRGQILLMTMLAITVLAGMIFYVYNAGTQINKRVELQHAADSAAISGTAWMARSMNLVAMNNIQQVKLMSNSLLLDSMPLATEMAHNEMSAWDDALLNQLKAGVPEENNVGPLLRRGLEFDESFLARQRQMLEAMNNLLNHSDFHMEETTFWRLDENAPVPQGSLWKAVAGLQQFSQATVKSCGVLAQSNAVRWGSCGVQSPDGPSRAELAFLAPVLPTMPTRLGEFRDFALPLIGTEQVRQGEVKVPHIAQGAQGAGGAIPDAAYPHRLGPFARLWYWRDAQYTVIPGTPGTPVTTTKRVWIPPQPATPPADNISGIPEDGASLDGTTGPPLGGGGTPARPGHWETVTNTVYVGGTPDTRLLIGYTTYGPLRPQLEYVRRWCLQNLRYSKFDDYLTELMRIKLQYMFTEEPQLRRVRRPNWTCNYKECVKRGIDKDQVPLQTMYYSIRIYSRYPEGGAGWLSPGSYWCNVEDAKLDGAGYRQIPLTCWYKGWYDLSKPKGTVTWTKLMDHVWKRTAVGHTTCLRQIGIEPGTGSHPVYFVEYRFFGALNVDASVEVRNPYNWRKGEELPRPTVLDTSGEDYDPQNPGKDSPYRRKYFMFLGAARNGADSELWSAQFGKANPSGTLVAVAQAELFNNRSWDLWTQDWQAQLVPVTNWDDWAAQMDTQAQDASATSGLLQPNQVRDVGQWMKALDAKLVETYMQH